MLQREENNDIFQYETENDDKFEDDDSQRTSYKKKCEIYEKRRNH